MSFLYLPSENVVHPTWPPIEVTAVLPIRTLFEAFTLALYPMAVAFLKLLPETSALYPRAVLKEPVKLESKAPSPSAELALLRLHLLSTYQRV